MPNPTEIEKWLKTVLVALYLLFNEGYYSERKNSVIRPDLCLEAMRLAYLLVQNEQTDQHSTNALLSLMCFHSSRLEARQNENGETILYEDQDENLWNAALIEKGNYYLNQASQWNEPSTYYLEAKIAY